MVSKTDLRIIKYPFFFLFLFLRTKLVNPNRLNLL